VISDLFRNNRLWSEGRRREDPDYFARLAALQRPEYQNLLSVLEFAVDVLEVKHIIVCGHHGCGGVRAALEPHHHGVVDHWLQPIRDIADDAAANLPDQTPPDARDDRICELSVRVQVNNLARTPIIRDAWSRGVGVQLHGWVYGLTDGLLHDLHCDVGPRVGSIEETVP
jgi:carbonic anhydrase